MQPDEQKLRNLKVLSERNSRVVERIVDQLVAKYNQELNQLVEEVRVAVKSGREISVQELEEWTLKIPVYMYFSGSGVELLGIEGDNARAIKDEAYNQAYQALEQGTIGDRKSHAELHTFNERLVDIAFQRAYKKLKLQLDNADRLFSAVKKLLQKRMDDGNVNLRDRGQNYSDERRGRLE